MCRGHARNGEGVASVAHDLEPSRFTPGTEWGRRTSDPRGRSFAGDRRAWRVIMNGDR